LLLLVAGCEQQVTGVGVDTSAGAKSVVREGDVNTVSFNVPGMTCEGCAAMVGDALAKSTGVENCTVDLEHKVANVKVDPAKFKAEDALKALVAAGYEDSTLKH
jgi:copper chaperone CopZ